MPLKGKEEEFLSGNQDRAFWVLNQQCRKFGNKPEDLVAVLKAFKQYFDKGHVIFLKDLDSSVIFKKISKIFKTFLKIFKKCKKSTFNSPF